MRAPSTAVPRPGRRFADDAGFAMIEVIVSAVVVVIFGLATLSLIDGSTKLASDDEGRAVAVGLAQNDINRMRSLQIDSLVASAGSGVTSTVVVKSRSYNVRSKAVWANDTGTVDLSCSSSDTTGARYARVSSTVSWASMGSVKPVVVESIIAPRTSGADAFQGTLVFKVVNAQGVGVAGVTVAPAGEAAVTTDASGCAIFPRVAQGDLDVNYAKTGYVDPSGDATPTESVSVAAGQKSIVTVPFDQAAQLSVTQAATSAMTLPSTWATDSKTDGTSPSWAAATGGAVTFSSLYPLAGGYAVYAGKCEYNDPSKYVTNGSTSLAGSTATPGPGQTATATAYVQPLVLSATGAYVTLPSGYGAPKWSATANTSSAWMTAHGATGTGACTESTTSASSNAMTLTGTKATGTLVLPFGVWDVCVQATNGSTTRKAIYTYNNVPPGTARTATPTPPTQTTPSGWSITTSSTTGTCP